ncbi:ubiquitin binding protein [Phellopilus nigrolimitatus]|nr:ubiquitin binding protein [Phellopilus nigrolimitatus]
MSLSSWLWGSTQVDEAIDKATSELMPTGTEDIALNLEISDQIRSKSVPPKDAMRALKRRLNHKNPNVQLLALSLTDTCIKNGGDHFLVEIASREFMDNLVSILKIPVLNLDVKNKMLRLIQNWAIAFEGKLSLSYVEQVYKVLKSEGFIFPPQDLVVASSAMVDTQTAPEWIDSDVCLRCRDAFSFTNRKHHCRNCGQVFDQKCSSKAFPLPHFGIQQDVRVCDGCAVKLTKNKKEHGMDRRHHSFSSPRHRSGRDLADAELQRAIQLSLDEVGAASANGRTYRPGYTPSQPEPPKWQTSEPPLVDRATRPSGDEEEDDAELRAAIEASLREASAPRPSAPIPVETPRSETQNFLYPQSQSYPTSSSASVPTQPNYDLQPVESDVILTFSQTVQEVESRGGRDIARYPAVNELYDKANGLRPKLALSLDDADRKEKALGDMHDKLSQAVKLYDKLLTDQLSRPAWRAAPQQAATGRYNTADGSYNQWAPQGGPPTAYGPTPYGLPQASQSPPPVNAPYGPVRQSSYSADPQPSSHMYASVPLQHYSSPPPAPAQLPHQMQSTSQYAPLPYNPSMPPVSYATPSVPLSQSPPPQPALTTPYTLPISTPAPIPQSQSQPAQSSPALSRQNTLSYVPPCANAVFTGAYPHAIATATASTVPPQSQLQAQTQMQFPHFPVAPTSNPQSFPLYESRPRPNLEQTERKEALLIDL